MWRWAVLIVLSRGGPALAADPAALTVRPSHPDEQLRALLALFEGAKAPDPAAALAGWTRANAGARPLPKATEALIALLNPAMVRELCTLDGAEVAIRFGEDGERNWSAIVPEDDGTFAALGTALALTGGATEPPEGAMTLDRLGPPGSALLGRSGASVAVAGTRDELDRAFAKLPLPPLDAPPGLRVRLLPEALGKNGLMPRRRVAAALDALACREVVGDLGLDGSTLALIVAGRWDGPKIAPKPLDPEWLDWVPAEGTVAAFALALDPRPEAWDALFAAADRVEKADPARAGLPPIRNQINLLALAAGVQLEANLWPHLVGVTAFATAGPADSIEGALIALHADDEAAASRIGDRLLPRLAAAARLIPRDAPADPDGNRPLGRVSGRPLRVARRGSTVLIAWGQTTLAAALDAQDHPEHSAGPSLRTTRPPQPPQRIGALWPGRLPGLDPGSPLADGLKGAPPVVWRGALDGETSRDEVRWPGLRGVVHRVLDRLPMDPPPDRAGLVPGNRPDSPK